MFFFVFDIAEVTSCRRGQQFGQTAGAAQERRSAFVAGDALVLVLVLLMPMLLLLLLLVVVQRKRASVFGVYHMLAEFMLKHGTGDIGRFVNKMGASAAVSVTTHLSAGFRKISMCARCLHSSHVLTLRSATASCELRWESAHKDAMLRNLDSPLLDCMQPAKISFAHREGGL